MRRSLVFRSGFMESPQDRREPDRRGQVIQRVDRCDDETSVTKGDADEQGGFRGEADALQKTVTEQKPQIEMQADVQIEGPGKGQEGEDQARRIEDAGLKVAEERSAAEVIRAPVGDNSVLQGLGEEVLSRIKPPVHIPKEERVAGEKNRVEKEKHQEGRYSEADMIDQAVRSHCCLFFSHLLAEGEPVGKPKMQTGSCPPSKRIV